MKLKKTDLIPLIALVFAAITLTAITAGVLTAHQNIPTSVKVDVQIASTTDIGVYSNSEGTITCTNVHWGTLNQGSTATKTIYIKNTGNISESLNMIIINWTPSFDHSPVALTWSQEGTILEAGSIVPATLILKVAADTSSLSAYRFNIEISGIS